MENLKQYQLNRNIMCIDLKSFYASVECILRGLDPFETPLVVADKERGISTIVLAITPYLKEKGLPSRCRINEIPSDIEVIYARPRMQSYIEYSTKVIETYLEFVSEEDLFVYSIDEVFLDVTNYLKYYGMTDYELGIKILNRIFEKLGLRATAGIGPNMLIAKLAMDIEAKKVKDFIAKWNYEDIKIKLWPIEKLSSMWGIGHRMERNLNLLGISKIGDIASYNKDKLKKRFGVLGEELWYHTHGIDMSLLQNKDQLRKSSKSFGSGQVLFRDYNANEITTIILEMVDEVTGRLRKARKSAKTISLSIGYSKKYGGGFSRQITLDYPTSSPTLIYQTCLQIFDLYYEAFPIRSVAVSLSNLDDNKNYQLSIFEDATALDNEMIIQKTLDNLKIKHGKNKILKASALEEHSTAIQRNKQIGGHHV